MAADAVTRIPFLSLPVIDDHGTRTDCQGCVTEFRTDKNITTEGFLNRLRTDGIPDSDLPPIDQKRLSASEGSPLAQTIKIGNKTVGNRCCIHPMEGWDANADGTPTDLTFRRWRRFGESGAKLIWGGEAFAVDPNGRANPRQLYFSDKSERAMRDLLNSLREAHNYRYGAKSDQDLMVGLQLTHSGRFCKPNNNGKAEPKVMYHHPLLDLKKGFAIDPKKNDAILSDDDIDAIIKKYVEAAQMAEKAGYDFVDIKACHGYLLHESLSAFNRTNPDGSKSKYGGATLEERSRFLKTIIKQIRDNCPRLKIGVRLSAFDTLPFEEVPGSKSAKYPNGKVRPMKFDAGPDNLYPGFGVNRTNPLEIDLKEPIQLLQELSNPFGDYHIDILNVTAGSPYYSWLIQRPANVPAGGIAPSEDPYTGATRHLVVTKQLKEAVPGLPMVTSAMTPFMEMFPNIAQAAIREGYTDFVGLGRGILSAPHFFDHVLKGQSLKGDLDKVCRTLSECTNSVRNTDTEGNAFKSACFPFDKDPRVLFHKARYHKAVGKPVPDVPTQRVLLALDNMIQSDPVKAKLRETLVDRYGSAYPNLINVEFSNPDEAAGKLGEAAAEDKPYKLAIVENKNPIGNYQEFTSPLKAASSKTHILELDRNNVRRSSALAVETCGDSKLRVGTFDRLRGEGTLNGDSLTGTNTDSFDYVLDQTLFAPDRK